MKPSTPRVIGQSQALASALDHLSSLAGINRPALVIGERGTGKELAAERLHFLSPRWSSPLIKINCSALTESLLESELFGHEAGAFTGATQRHIGRFERADTGTVFLDELGTMSPRLQEKLLRLIEYGEFERVGGQKTLSVDVRIVAATHADLRALADKGEFRWDLLDRLSFDVVRMPPLRERADDIDALAEHFALQFCAELNWPVFHGFTPTALKTLQSYAWPGNVRELKNAVERSLYRWGDADSPIDAIVINPFDQSGQATVHGATDDPSADAHPSASLETADSADSEEAATMWPIDLAQKRRELERQWLVRALEDSQYRQRDAAVKLSLSYDQLRNLVKKYALRSRRARSN